LTWVNCTREAIAPAAFTLNLDPPIRHLVAEWRCGLEVDGIPADFHKGVAASVHVCARDVRAPVPDWVGITTPDTGVRGGNSWGVNVVAITEVREKKKKKKKLLIILGEDVLSSGSSPIFRTWDSEGL
jgi:hypothetical protein